MPNGRSEKPSALTQAVTLDVLALLDGPPDAGRLEQALRHLAKWRARLIQNTLTARNGCNVLSGPFKGLIYDTPATEGAGVARLIGCYEASLAPVFEQIIAGAYPLVVDVGCAEGYYAVGLARRMPDTRIMACDSNPEARAACAALARRNGVDGRVTIHGTLDHADLAVCADQRTLILCDIEGAEAVLLDPERAPALIHADILVEVHECFTPGLTDEMTQRFAPTHRVQRIGRSADTAALPDWMEQLSDLDRLLCLWEWRMGPTPWLWMQARDPR
ncbi:hypothetical protein AN189_06785 [Loktanella sp. 3ANDIMAR09]|uniref:methyltransferase domain-containing protein n=1 Tax=Loktanella sp. 3ANDIMAR09 TaxID=1225657 RepID=UPI0006FAE6CF|nr:class I SAM-dependent methyltransferase [Loktanella sp. 3ANDIMAR09]KQI69253.1 hypothetical protein AN189_06785 [Loktanella sp. 3ANDIMAR09]